VKILARLVVILTFTLSVLSTRAISQSDESGTLVMVARTTSGIVVTVDSAITTRDPITHLPTVITDPTRKLVDFGEFGACTVDAFTGDAERGNIIADEARRWLRANPTARGFEALNGILVIAATSWNSEHYPMSYLGTYPANRRVGDTISHIVCGDLFGDNFMIIEADTTVAADGTASIGRGFGIGASFEFGGSFDYPTLLGLIDNKEAPPTATEEFRRIYPAVRQDILSDPSVVDALRAFIDEQKRTTDIREKTVGQPVMPKPALTQSQVQTLFAAAYKSVEQYTIFVGAPNNVRLLTKCGRFATTVEAPWPVCKQ
jgi:hypothetical protein